MRAGDKNPGKFSWFCHENLCHLSGEWVRLKPAAGLKGLSEENAEILKNVLVMGFFGC